MCPCRVFSSHIGSRHHVPALRAALLSSRSNSRRYIKPLDLARLFNLNSALASITPLKDWPPPSPLQLLLEVSCPVDCCRSCAALLVSTKRTAALLWRSQDHCSRTCSPTHHQYRRNISGRRHLHRNNFRCTSHFITEDVLTKCTPKSVLCKCTIDFISEAC